LGLLEEGRTLGCIWTGQRLNALSLDVDHCLPWSAWPCGDLWNLLPTHRRVNQRLKRDRLPSAEFLERARQLVLDWWEAAYLGVPSVGLAERFFVEARASLPGLKPGGGVRSAEEVYAGVGLQRLRLRQDQLVPEWSA
jgi:HNH endonuclease